MKVKMKQGKQNKIENSSRKEFLVSKTPENKAENFYNGGGGRRWTENEEGGDRGV